MASSFQVRLRSDCFVLLGHDFARNTDMTMKREIKRRGDQPEQDGRSTDLPASGFFIGFNHGAQWNAPFAITSSEGGVGQE